MFRLSSILEYVYFLIPVPLSAMCPFSQTAPLLSGLAWCSWFWCWAPVAACSATAMTPSPTWCCRTTPRGRRGSEAWVTYTFFSFPFLVLFVGLLSLQHQTLYCRPKKERHNLTFREKWVGVNVHKFCKKLRN